MLEISAGEFFLGQCTKMTFVLYFSIHKYALAVKFLAGLTM